MSSAEQRQLSVASEGPENTSSDLTVAGSTWLSTSIEFDHAPGLVSELLAPMRESFGISEPEALTALVTALSLAVGPAICVADPFGHTIPVSLQMLWRRSVHCGFDKAMEFLSGSIAKKWTSMVAPGPSESRASIEANMVGIGNDLARISSALAALENGSTQDNHASPSAASTEEFMKQVDRDETIDQWQRRLASKEKSPDVATQRDKLRLLKQKLISGLTMMSRRQGMSPFGDTVDRRLIKGLADENRDFAFSSFSPTGTALGRLIDESGSSRAIALDFLGAGWSGAPLSGLTAHSAYPTAALAWSTSRQDMGRASQLLSLLPGLLIILPNSGEPGDTPKLQPLTPGAQTFWEDTIERIIEQLRLPVARRFSSEMSESVYSFTPEATNLIIDSAYWSAKYSLPGGRAEGILERAQYNLMKIAALLSIDRSFNRKVTIDVQAVRNASGLYRWLARSTTQVAAAGSGQGTHIDQLVQAILVKLKMEEHPLSLRDIARRFHKQGPYISEALCKGVDLGKIQKVGGKFTVATASRSARPEFLSACQRVSSSN